MRSQPPEHRRAGRPMSILPTRLARDVPRGTLAGYAALPRMTAPCMTAPCMTAPCLTAPRLHTLMACVVICAGLALAGKTLAQETAPGIVTPTGPAQTDPAQASTTNTATPDRSTALLQVIALRRELAAQVKALTRLAAYQKELLALANTRDVDAVLRARRARQSCFAELGATALCDALGVSFTDDATTMQNRGDAE